MTDTKTLPENTLKDRFLQGYAALLRETFEHGEGIYLDTGTSLLETLAAVSAEEASRPLCPQGATVAAHVRHACLYLSVLGASLQNEPVGKVDWEEIWRSPQSVTPPEWDALRQDLREAYRQAVAVMEEQDAWEEDRMQDALAILAHNAYHLGAIRQILFVVR